MHLANVIVVLVAMLIAGISAQCPRTPRRPDCAGGRNIGRSSRGCSPGTRWWYDARSRTCRSMAYRGCDGNNNRYCSKAACEQRCVRR